MAAQSNTLNLEDEADLLINMHLATVFLDSPVSLDICRCVFWLRRCIRLILPIMSMVITFFISLLKNAAGYVKHLAQICIGITPKSGSIFGRRQHHRF